MGEIIGIIIFFGFVVFISIIHKSKKGGTGSGSSCGGGGCGGGSGCGGGGGCGGCGG